VICTHVKIAITNRNRNVKKPIAFVVVARQCKTDRLRPVFLYLDIFSKVRYNKSMKYWMIRFTIDNSLCVEDGLFETKEKAQEYLEYETEEHWDYEVVSVEIKILEK
jgi:hypothetical protein